MFFKLFIVKGNMRNLVGCYGNGAAVDRATYNLYSELSKDGPCRITGWIEVTITLV